MTGLHHHPHDETLMSFSAGTLDPAFALVVSCHLQFCSRCRSEVRTMEEIGGLLLEAFKAGDAEPAFFASTMERFAHQFAEENGTRKPAQPVDAGSEVIMPAPLARLTGLRRETIPWSPVAHGLRRFDLPSIAGAKASAQIVNIEAGAILPPEKHGGQVVLVLWGAYDYGSGHFQRGDLHDIGASGFRGFKAASAEGVTYLTAISPVAQFEILRTAH